MPDRPDDPDFELFLRRFEPRAPSRLPTARRASRWTWWALAAASLAASALWLGSPHEARSPVGAVSPDAGPVGLAPTSTSRVRPTLAELSVVLRPGESARVAGELEEHVLADPRRRGGALRAMASDGPAH